MSGEFLLHGIDSARPWWQVLPEDFCELPRGTVLDEKYALKVQGTAALDLVLRTGLALAVMSGMAPNMLLPSRVRREMEQVQFYQALADRADPGAVFQRPPRGVPIKKRAPGLLDYQPKGVTLDLLEFESPYVALNPAVREAYARFPRNRQVATQHWRHADGPRPTLIFIHGYFLDAYWVNSLMFSLRWFYRQGYDILLYTLPFHGARRATLDPFSGYGYFVHGFAHVNEAMLQAVYDLRIWMDYLEDSGVPAMGVSGLSLGGYISALAAAVDERLAFAIPNAPVVSPGDMILEWQPINWLLRYSLPRRGLGVRDLRHFLALHCPLTYAPLLPPKRLLIIGGAGDRFTAPRYIHLLHEHWQGSQLHWFPGNHVLHLHQGEYLKLMKRFMDRCCGA